MGSYMATGPGHGTKQQNILMARWQCSVIRLCFVPCLSLHHQTHRTLCMRTNYASAKVNIGTTRKWEFSFILRPHYCRCPLNTRLSGPRSQSVVPAGIWTPDRPTPCLVTIPTLSLIPVNINHQGARGGVMVKALRYKPAGRGFHSRWCQWNFSVT